jgi:hypothetical protein
VTFWIAWGIDLIAGLILLAFFAIGVVDGSVSSFNLGLWLVILAIAGVVLLGGLALRHTHARAALALVMLAAVPCALLGLFFLVVMVVPARWN